MRMKKPLGFVIAFSIIASFLPFKLTENFVARYFHKQPLILTHKFEENLWNEISYIIADILNLSVPKGLDSGKAVPIYQTSYHR